MTTRSVELQMARESEAPRVEAVLACTRLTADSTEKFEQLVIATEQQLNIIAEQGLRALLNA